MFYLNNITKFLFLLLAICSLCICVSSVSFAEEKTTEDAPLAISELISQLDSDFYDLREEAEQALSKRQDVTVPLLEAALKKSRLESYIRLKRVLKIVRLRANQVALQEFIDDPQATLPHWEFFKQKIGSSQKHRELFIRLHLAEPKLMAIPIAKAKNNGKEEEDDFIEQEMFLSLQSRLQFLYVGMRTRNSSFARSFTSNRSISDSHLAILFLSSYPEFKTSSSGGIHILTTITKSLSLTNLPQMKEIKANPCLKDLLNHWLKECRTVQVYNRLQIADRIKWKGATMVLADEIIQTKTPKHYYATAIQMKASCLQTKAIPWLIKMLDDKTDAGYYKRKNFSTKTCDVALLSLATITKKSPKEVGFTRQLSKRGGSAYHVSQIGFKSDKEREAAIAKWVAWWAKNKSTVLDAKKTAPKDNKARPEPESSSASDDD